MTTLLDALLGADGPRVALLAALWGRVRLSVGPNEQLPLNLDV